MVGFSLPSIAVRQCILNYPTGYRLYTTIFAAGFIQPYAEQVNLLSLGVLVAPCTCSFLQRGGRLQDQKTHLAPIHNISLGSCHLWHGLDRLDRRFPSNRPSRQPVRECMLESRLPLSCVDRGPFPRPEPA